MEGESGNLSEVTEGFSAGTPAIIIIFVASPYHVTQDS